MTSSTSVQHHTVGHMRQNNAHVKGTPEIMLKHDDTPVSSTELKVHAAATGSLYALWPASSIPSAIKNHDVFLIGGIIGFAIGIIARLFYDTLTPPTVSYLKNVEDRLVHWAAMNAPAKTVLALAHSSGISANAVLGTYTNSSYVQTGEGFFVGAVIGYQFGGIISHVIQPAPSTSSIPSLPSRPSANGETTPLITASSSAVV